MRIERGRWLVDGDSKILRYRDTRRMQLFAFPPEGPLTLSEALAWVAGHFRWEVSPEEDLNDLARAFEAVQWPGPRLSPAELLPRLRPMDPRALTSPAETLGVETKTIATRP
jgi:hypothetical protein